MTTHSGDFWDVVYSEEGYRYGTEPNHFLVDRSVEIQPGGAVLCLGDGEGRNGVWLAAHGFDVTSVDASAVGIRKTEMLAREKGVTLRTIHATLPEVDLGEGIFDAVVLIYLHLPPGLRQAVHALAVRLLKPGGMVVLEAFTPDQLRYGSGGPRNPEMLYTAEMLREDFGALEIQLLEECDRDLSEGNGHEGRAAVVRFVGKV